MIVCLSGLSRANRIDTLLTLKDRLNGVVVEYTLEESPTFISNIDCWVIVHFDIKALWSKYKYAWSEESSTKLSRLVKKYGSLDLGRDFLREEIKSQVEAYRDWCLRYYSYIDVISLPNLPSSVDVDWYSVFSGLEDRCMPTIDFKEDNLLSLLKTYKFIGVSSSVSDLELRTSLVPLRGLLREENIKLHGWGRGNKETISQRIFWSVSSPSWLSGERYGNIYNYVGNLKLVLQNKKTSKVKNAKIGLRSKCLSLNIDYDLFLKEDRDTINLWNAHQWVLLSRDAHMVTLPPESGERVMETKNKKNQQTQLERKNQDTKLASREAGIGYLRECNSCYLASQCPAFMEDSDCSISTRPRVDTPDDVNALLNRIIEIQGERVLFTAFAEKTQGMGLNPEVSKEMEVLTKIIKDSKEIMNPLGQDEVMIKAKGSGVISRLFGGYGREGGGSKPSQSERIIDVSPLEDKDE